MQLKLEEFVGINFFTELEPTNSTKDTLKKFNSDDQRVTIIPGIGPTIIKIW